MMAISISDRTAPANAGTRVMDQSRRKELLGSPDAICIRNDEMPEDWYTSFTGVLAEVWDGPLVLETFLPSNLNNILGELKGRDITVVGANATNIEEFAGIPDIKDCRVCISSDDLEELFDTVIKAESLGLENIALDPMVRNMKQCLEVCTHIKRLSETVPQARYPVVIRSWTGEYAMAMALVASLICDPIIILEDIDDDTCEIIKTIADNIR